MAADARRKVPSVDALLRSGPGQRATATFGRPLLKQSVTAVVAEVRAEAAEGEEPPFADEILAAAVARAARVRRRPDPGDQRDRRAAAHEPRPRAAGRPAVRAVDARAAAGLRRPRGRPRQRRARHRAAPAPSACSRPLTGAEAALVVNNCAAALRAGARRAREGQARPRLARRADRDRRRVPDPRHHGRVAARASSRSARRTARAHADYAKALDDRTAAILKVHPSNYRVVGFTAEAPRRRARHARAREGHPVPVRRRARGCSTPSAGSPARSRPCTGALDDGADLVTFSGDKLLGGPQAGCIVGRADLVARLRRHPLARAVRVDKLQVAGARGDARPVRARRARRGPRAPDDPRVGATCREARASPARDDRRRPRGRRRTSCGPSRSSAAGRSRASASARWGVRVARARPARVRAPAARRPAIGVLPRRRGPRAARRAHGHRRRGAARRARGPLRPGGRRPRRRGLTRVAARASSPPRATSTTASPR